MSKSNLSIVSVLFQDLLDQLISQNIKGEWLTFLRRDLGFVQGRVRDLFDMLYLFGPGPDIGVEFLNLHIHGTPLVSLMGAGINFPNPSPKEQKSNRRAFSRIAKKRNQTLPELITDLADEAAQIHIDFLTEIDSRLQEFQDFHDYQGSEFRGMYLHVLEPSGVKIVLRRQ